MPSLITSAAPARASSEPLELTALREACATLHATGAITAEVMIELPSTDLALWVVANGGKRINIDGGYWFVRWTVLGVKVTLFPPGAPGGAE